jgi:hypothetical protein
MDAVNAFLEDWKQVHVHFDDVVSACRQLLDDACSYAVRRFRRIDVSSSPSADLLAVCKTILRSMHPVDLALAFHAVSLALSTSETFQKVVFKGPVRVTVALPRLGRVTAYPSTSTSWCKMGDATLELGLVLTHFSRGCAGFIDNHFDCLSIRSVRGSRPLQLSMQERPHSEFHALMNQIAQSFASHRFSQQCEARSNSMYQLLDNPACKFSCADLDTAFNYISMCAVRDVIVFEPFDGEVGTSDQVCSAYMGGRLNKSELVSRLRVSHHIRCFARINSDETRNYRMARVVPGKFKPQNPLLFLHTTSNTDPDKLLHSFHLLLTDYQKQDVIRGDKISSLTKAHVKATIHAAASSPDGAQEHSNIELQLQHNRDDASAICSAASSASPSRQQTPKRKGRASLDEADARPLASKKSRTPKTRY